MVHGLFFLLNLISYIIGNKSAFRLKRNPDGSISQYKSWLVAKGYHQHPDIDYKDTFSSVVKPQTIKMVLCIALSKRWNLMKMDVYNAFLNGTLSENVYMVQPPGFVHQSHPNYVLSFISLSMVSSKLLVHDSSPTDDYGSTAKVEATKPKKSPIPAQSQVITTDTDRFSKNQLQNYARKNNLDSPVFTIKTKGLPHDIHYKATVVIDGKSFESPTFFNTIKEAEQTTAKIALRELPISVDLFQKDESCPSKSLLLELTQREGYSKPTYTTTESGSPHMPTFFSTVDVEGLKFHGKASRSKKQADIDAAKIAYIALKECGLDMYAAFSSSIKGNQVAQSILESDIVKYKQILNSEGKILAPEILPTDDVKVNNESFPIPPNKKMKMSNMSSSSSPKSSPLSHTELPSTISDSNMAMTSNTSNYLLCDGFKVYTSFPDIVFPEDITVLPIDNDKWVAACLEFPNDKDF